MTTSILVNSLVSWLLCQLLSVSFWLPLSASGYLCQLLVPSVSFWLPLSASGYLSQLLVTSVSFWLPLSASGYLCQLLVTIRVQVVEQISSLLHTFKTGQSLKVKYASWSYLRLINKPRPSIALILIIKHGLNSAYYRATRRKQFTKLSLQAIKLERMFF